MKNVILLVIVAFALIFGCAARQVEAQKDFAGAIGKETAEKQDAMMKENEAMMNETSDMMKKSQGMEGANTNPMYKGEKIAGTTTPYLRFNNADYEKAISEGKVIYLYFYANWCPICAAERPNILNTFNGLRDPSVLGFEVHFKDSETNAEDISMASKFGVPYQHTTIILQKGGAESFRSLSPISGEEIKTELEKAKNKK